MRPEGIQQRRDPRFAVALECNLHHEGQTITGQTENLSRGGVSMVLPIALEISTVVDLSLALMFDSDSYSEKLQLKATIVWCSKLKDGKHQIGAKFGALDKELRSYLETFLHFLEAGTEDAADHHDDEEA
jgi:hypothetical protein